MRVKPHLKQLTSTQRKYIYCEKCGTLVEQVNNKIKYCKKCAKNIQFEQKKEWDKTKRIR